MIRPTLFAVAALLVFVSAGQAQDDTPAFAELDRDGLIMLAERQHNRIVELEAEVASLKAQLEGDSNKEADPAEATDQPEGTSRRRRPDTHRDISRMLRGMPEDVTPGRGQRWQIWKEAIDPWLAEEFNGDIISMSFQINMRRQASRDSLIIDANSISATEIQGTRVFLAMDSFEITDVDKIASILSARDRGLTVFDLDIVVTQISVDEQPRVDAKLLLIPESIELGRARRR